jgi:hypothetical protein
VLWHCRWHSVGLLVIKIFKILLNYLKTLPVINAFAVQLFRATGLDETWATMANVGLSILCMVGLI